MRRLTLSLSRIEEKLDVFYHEQKQVTMSLEDIKEILLNMPLFGEWAEFRKARPEAVQALNRADEHFLAGRRDEGARELLALVRQRGVGEETVCRALGIEAFARGQLREANGYLTRSVRGKPALTAGLAATLTALGTAATRGPRLPVWRSLPRGLVVDRRYRIEAEVGRGGMASVYRALGVDWVNRDRVVALKVPAADLLADAAARGRFITEIQVAQKLSGKHPAILETLGYAVFDDPHSGRELYGLVLEFIDGPTLAHFLTQRQAKGRPLEPREIVHILKPVCEALEYAHSQGVCHRDVKPQNVLLAACDTSPKRQRGGRATLPLAGASGLCPPALTPDAKPQAADWVPKLADFGIARVLEDARATVTGQAEVGTLTYMPPDRDFDARSDVYLLGNLLLELLTFDPRGDVEARADCPPAWAELVADSMNRLKGKRPQTAREFLARLEEQTQPPPPPPQPPPPPGPDPIGMQRAVVNSLGMKLVLVPRGTFWMGDRGNQRQVTISHDFYLGVFPVTQEQWQAIMGSNPSHFSRNGSGAAKVKGISEADLKQFPVEQVSWEDVQEFLKRLNAREKDSGFLYRLPTEAEWEYACRGGATSQQECNFDFYFGDSSRNLSQPTNDLSSEQANFDGNHPAGNAPKGKYLGRTTKVGSYKPNRLGIYDMHGDVWEWCEDHFEAGAQARAVRGGSWNDHGSYCRSSDSSRLEPAYRYNLIVGFRVAAVPSGE